MRRVILAAAAIAAVLPFNSAMADHACASTVVDVAGTAYVVVDDPNEINGGHGSIWIYQESNGNAGLQRNDDSCRDDEGGSYDTIIF
jgi:hypothetical protein